MRIAVLHDRLNPTVAAAMDRLRARGVVVEAIGPDVPAAELADLQPSHDLYYLKTSAEPLLTLAGVLHAAGAKTINPYPSVAMLSNKLVATAMLRRAGLPVPETWIANDALALAELLGDGSLILKPCRGSRGRGIRIVRHAGELVGPIDVPVLAQRYHPGDGMDRKLYCIGDRVFGLLRPWPCVSWDEKLRHGTPFTPDERLRELALRCGQALGLSLFGLDLVPSSGTFLIVDVNKCAGFIGVPDAPSLLCEHLAACARAAGA